MSVFGNILGAIFGKKESKAQSPALSTPSNSPSTATAATVSTPSPSTADPIPQSPPAAPSGSVSQPAPVSQVDIAEVLDQKAESNSESLDWRKSIVDLMKLLGIESSLSARKELADELGYDGDKGDSAAMNIWLHQAVLKKLAENGGRVPQDLLD